MIPENDWYGHKTALSDYLGESRQDAFLGLMAHGWAPDLAEGVGRRRMTFAPFFVWNARLLSQAKTEGVRNVHCIGSPFCYLVKDRIPRSVSAGGEGTIIFPAHSTDGPPIEYETERFIRQLKDEMPAPFTVSIYYMDSNTAATRAYQEAGFRVVSFGRRMQSDFLERMADEIESHATVVSNVAQTSVWYGALLGKQSRVIGLGAHPVAPGQEPEVARTRWPALFRSDVTSDEYIALGEEELGFGYLLEPAELRAALGIDSWWKRQAAREIRRAVDSRLERRFRRSGVDIDGLSNGQPRLLG
ncbi:MAG: hypothetical protein PSX37_00925 [bacterium]|nr:hypothetical protein [bacterium]